MKKIKVPATSANLGCGFDSVGLAVNLYLELEILEPSEKWEIEHNLGAHIPHDESNLIITTALKLAPNLSPHKLRMTSQIPSAGGLGSSSSALVAGIELACTIGGASLTKQEKLLFACDMEGHADNVVPAMLGGLVVSAYQDKSLEYIEVAMPNVALVAYVPSYTMSTAAMRKILPTELDYKEAVLASSVSNVMIASLMSGDFERAGRMMEQDRFHEKYRSALIPELEEVRETARKHKSYATYLSGSGATIMCMTPPDKADNLAAALEKRKDAKIIKLAIDANGVI